MNIITVILAAILLASSAPAAAETVDELPRVNSVAVYQGETTKIFAATQGGIYKSTDNGSTWAFAGAQRLPATLISAAVPGQLYAFVVGQGLLRLDGKGDQWQILNNRFGSQVLVELSAEPGNPDKLVGLNQFGKLVVSENAGRDWHSIRGIYKAGSEAEARGAELYRKNCQSCHGVDGVGETYTVQALTEKNYIRAPAMNDSEHAWHHTDDALVKTILEGSPRSPRMIAWGKAGLDEQNARDLVAYIKSLWTQRELDCQGPKHMQCMGRQ